MKLEVFSRKMGKESLIQSIVMGYGNLRFTQALLEQMGSPKFVELAIDPAEKFVGIRKCDETNANKFKVSDSHQVSCSYFCKAIRRLIQNDKDKFVFQCDGEQDGYFIFDLKKGENRNGK